MVLDHNEEHNLKPVIKVVGVGGGGCNAINRMIGNDVKSVEFIAMNTDSQALKVSKAHTRVQLGRKLTRGLGAGGKPEEGRLAALESESEIRQLLTAADLVFVTTGMGGGTGTLAIAEVAKIAKEQGALTVGIVTTPFDYEGPMRMKAALEGVEELKPHCDTLIVIPNQKLFEIGSPNMTIYEGFKEADNVLRQGVQGVTELITFPGIINIDFADIRSALENKGTALMGVGVASGENRAVAATRKAMESKLLDVSIDGATHAIVNITSNEKLGLRETEEVTAEIRRVAGQNITIVPGLVVHEDLEDELIVTIIATGKELKTKKTDTAVLAQEWLTGSNKPENSAYVPEKKESVKPKQDIPDWLKKKS